MSSDLLQHLAAAASLSDESSRKGLTGKEEPRVLLVTTVDVGGGTSERIEVRVGEVPEDVARAFCRRHNLPDAIAGPLAAHLEENLRKAAVNRVAGDGKTEQSPQPSAGGGGGGGSGGGGPGLAPIGSGGPAAKQQHYSFGSGMDERLYQQLSNKLLDESQAPSTRRGNWVSASEVLSGGAGGGGGSGHNSKRSSSGLSNHPSGPYQYGKGNPAGPSPRGRDSVHLRLYATAQERAARLEERRRVANAEATAALTHRPSRMSWISAEMMRGRGANGAYDNYGEMLYAEGVEALMARLKRAESERRAREARELDGVTFAPTITKKAWELKQRERSNSMPAAMGGNGGAMDAGGEDFEKWQRLHMRGIRKSTQERLEHLRQQREAAEVAECTFRPRINRNSDILMMERSEALKQLNLTHYEQLFADAQRRQLKLEDLRNWYPEGVTFRPQVNKDPRALEYLRRSWDKLKYQQMQQQQQHHQQQQQHSVSRDTPGGAAVTSTASTATQGAGPAQVPSVVARLYAEAERKQAKLEAARQVANGPIDPVTQKPLFQPEIGRGPRGGVGHARSSRRGTHIGEHLYRTAQDLAAKRAAAEEAERRAAQEAATRSRTTVVSQRIFTDLKLKRFRQIFEYLDEDGSGSLDLLAVLGRSPPLEEPEAEPCRHPRADNLDSEVLLDVEAAADVWARANGLMLTNEEQRLASGAQAGGSPSAADSAADSPSKRRSQGPAGLLGSPAPGSGGLLSRPCPPMSIEMFMSCMEEALRLRRGPRAYLVPSPPAKQEPTHTFRPSINARSRALAAKARPDTASTFELLHRVAAKTAERLEMLRRKKEESALAGYTFQPQLNSNRNSLGGRTAGRSTASHTASLDPSAFALAAAGIAAAASGGDDVSPSAQALAAEAERRDLQQHLQHLRIAADAALDMQAQLLQQAVEAGEGEGAAELDHAEVDEDLARFTLLEQELRDMQALTQVAIDDHDRQQQMLRQAAPAQQQHVQQQMQQQQQSMGLNGADGAPPGGLQELAAVLGVGTWDGSMAQGTTTASS
ncbi:Glycosylphosphatidylinositol anchor attachment 1 protein [Pleodorina starrii]|uniref:Glycosylphosphatidylinositol anchor attachment 1 protein n=1 Tax=Pleodorina starrii TaxID=330485 RepID=A0A9W6C0D8_9CHLO|nr:Glycosylphosphatidylinositol anchor attachment 1 protein [Pleodorina starrii]